MIIAQKRRRIIASEGFSLIELVVVILILGILAAVVGPAVFRAVAPARTGAAKSSLRALSQAIDTYQAEIGAYPKALEDLVEKPSGAAGKKWTAPYLKGKSIPEDPWGEPFQYKITPGSQHPYELYSYGGPNGPDTPAEERIDVWNL